MVCIDLVVVEASVIIGIVAKISMKLTAWISEILLFFFAMNNTLATSSDHKVGTIASNTRYTDPDSKIGFGLIQVRYTKKKNRTSDIR